MPASALRPVLCPALLRPVLLRPALLLIGLGAGACAGEPAEKDDGGATDSAPVDSGGGDELPPAVCNAGQRWSAGTTAFVDASAAWGLPELMPVGVRMLAVDFDNDGWTDLLVRSGTTPDDFSSGARSTWLLRNTGDGRFEDRTEASGIVQPRGAGPNRAAPVMVAGDVDNDGDLDLYAGLPDAGSDIDETSELLLGDGNFGFTLGAEDSALRVARGDVPYGATWADVDHDGALDLFVGQYTSSSGSPLQDRLYRGDGAGGFVDATVEAGLQTQAWSSVSALNLGLSHTVAWSAASCDLNDDGLPELLAASYGRAPNHLWRNAGGSFINESVLSGYAYDDRQDWSDNESARCWCQLHPDAADCAGVPAPDYIACDSDDDAFRWSHTSDREAYRLGGNSGATTCADVNNDGWMDLLTSEIVHWDVGSSADPSELLFNQQQPEVRFSRPGNPTTGLTRTHSGVAWDDGDITGGVFDFDNDGWPDVFIGASDYPGTRGLLYHQTEPERFEAVPVEDGIDNPRSHGSVFADFDRDGDLDAVLGHSSARCGADCRDTFEVHLFENQLGADSNWVQLQLVGQGGSNRAAIGAKVRMTAGGLTQTHEVQGGGGQWGSQDDLVQHFGLGEACEGTVEVRWPDAEGTVETFAVVSGYRFQLVQGSGKAVVLP
ncbi:MAG: CRTAC1 family protein [Deltaproteobacteria bacterium]|jgi:hypothetical protein|nr:CRTAC1 family protein [Deltaproteobacteria bacterium]